MKTFNTTPEERLKQLERLLARTNDEFLDIRTTLMMIEGEISDLKMYMSTGAVHPDQLFEDLIRVNDSATHQHLDW